MAVSLTSLKPTTLKTIVDAQAFRQGASSVTLTGDDNVTLAIEVSSATLRPAQPERL